MKTTAVSICLAVAALNGANAFAPSFRTNAPAFASSQHVGTSVSVSAPSPIRTALHAKYNSMEEILALFPEDKPVLMNFYDAATEEEIKNDIFRAKTLLQDRCTVCSVKQQDYPEIAKVWDAADKTPSMILFKDGNPVMRLYEETHYLEITAKVGQYCRPSGEEHKPVTK